jgi:hypothetical protein
MYASSSIEILTKAKSKMKDGCSCCVESVLFRRRSNNSMPLRGDYNWSDKRDHILVEIPLKGVSHTKVDILGLILLQ